MSAAGPSRDTSQQMRQKARKLEEAAQTASDPQEREQLQAKARKLREQSEQQGGAAEGFTP
ncbi:DUF6381 family protein [Streptomyces fagopyri]